MKTKITTWMFAAVASAALFTGAATAAPATERVLDAMTIEKLSKEASTPEEHARVSRQYRLRAESLEAKAKMHEQEAERMLTGHNPMAAKWPAMVRNGADRERRLAIEARRAAQECYARADHHIRLAVEGKLSAE